MTAGLHSLTDLQGFSLFLNDGAPCQLNAAWFLRPDERECHITHLDVTALDGRPGHHALVPTGRIMPVDSSAHIIRIDMTGRELLRAGMAHSPPGHNGRYFLTNDFVGKPLAARDRDAGTLIDFLVDTFHWDVRYFEVAIDAHEVLVDPAWTNDIDGRRRRITVDLPHAAIAAAPEFSGTDVMNPGYCESLYRHYTSRKYLH